MYRTFDLPFQSARGVSAGAQRENSNRDENSHTNKFPIKKFYHKIPGSINSHPISPNTDRTDRVAENNKNLRNSNIDTTNHLSGNNSTVNIYYKNENPLHFLSSYQYKNPKRNSVESQEIDKRNRNQTLLNSFNPNNPSTIEEVSKKLNLLTERISKNEIQIERFKLSEIVSLKKIESNDITSILKQNRLFHNRPSKGDQGKDSNKQIQNMKKKIKQFHELISQTVPKKDFQMRIQSLQWKIKEYNTSNMSGCSIQKKQVSEVVSSELENSLAAIKENFEKRISDLIRNVAPHSKECPSETKQLSPQVKMRSNKFAIKAFSYNYQQKVTLIEDTPTSECPLNSSHIRHNTTDFASFSYLGVKKSPRKRQRTIYSATYHIDLEGYLLDSDKCYLIDSNQRQIRLTDEDIRTLRQLGVFDEIEN